MFKATINESGIIAVEKWLGMTNSLEFAEEHEAVKFRDGVPAGERARSNKYASYL